MERSSNGKLSASNAGNRRLPAIAGQGLKAEPK
jgi:hypothetical protein